MMLIPHLLWLHHMYAVTNLCPPRNHQLLFFTNGENWFVFLGLQRWHWSSNTINSVYTEIGQWVYKNIWIYLVGTNQIITVKFWCLWVKNNEWHHVLKLGLSLFLYITLWINVTVYWTINYLYMRLTRLKISNYSKIGGRHLARVYRIVKYSLQIYSTNVAGVYMGLHTDLISVKWFVYTFVTVSPNIQNSHHKQHLASLSDSTSHILQIGKYSHASVKPWMTNVYNLKYWQELRQHLYRCAITIQSNSN